MFFSQLFAAFPWTRGATRQVPGCENTLPVDKRKRQRSLFTPRPFTATNSADRGAGRREVTMPLHLVVPPQSETKATLDFASSSRLCMSVLLAG